MNPMVNREFGLDSAPQTLDGKRLGTANSPVVVTREDLMKLRRLTCFMPQWLSGSATRRNPELLEPQQPPATLISAKRSPQKFPKWTRRYDPVGNLTNIVHPVNSNIMLAFDSMNRLPNMVDGVAVAIP
jgi:hypothetical protein